MSSFNINSAPNSPTPPTPHHPRPSSGAAGKVALAISIVALFLALFRNPLGPVYDLSLSAFGGSLWGYDFSTPEAALLSDLEMENERDFAALIAYQQAMRGKKSQEKLDSFKVEKQKTVTLPETTDSTAKKREVAILFISFAVDGKTRYETVAMDKDAETGFWKTTFAGTFTVKSVDEGLAKEMEEWEAKSK